MWRYVAARARGTSHVRAGTPCQDQYTCLGLADGTFLAAIADGAGSAEHAESGALIAVSTAVQAMRQSVEAGRVDFAAVVREAVVGARAAVISEARANGEPSREFASTLLAVVLGPHGGAAAQLGDGVIVVEGEGAGWSWVFWPQHGEFVNTTLFLTDDAATEHLQVEAFVGEVSAVAMMSDGLERLALDHEQRTAHAPFFDGMFRVLDTASGEAEIPDLSSALGRYLQSEPVTSRTDDDVSLILARRLPRPNP